MHFVVLTMYGYANASLFLLLYRLLHTSFSFDAGAVVAISLYIFFACIRLALLMNSGKKVCAQFLDIRKKQADQPPDQDKANCAKNTQDQ